MVGLDDLRGLFQPMVLVEQEQVSRGMKHRN